MGRTPKHLKDQKLNRDSTSDKADDILEQLKGAIPSHAYHYPNIGVVDVRKVLHDAIAVNTPNYPVGETEYDGPDGSVVRENLFAKTLREDALITRMLVDMPKKMSKNNWEVIKDIYAYPHDRVAMVYCEEVDEPIKVALREFLSIFMNDTIIADEKDREKKRIQAQLEKEERARQKAIEDAKKASEAASLETA